MKIGGVDVAKLIGILGYSDQKVFHAINENTRCRFFDCIMPIITLLGGPTFTMSFVLALMLLAKGMLKGCGMICALSLLISFVITHSIKRMVNRERPWQKLNNVNVYNTNFRLYSFPSGHTTAIFSIAMALGLCFPAIYWQLFAISSLVGFSRIYLGVHYPTDVVAGAIIGLISAYMSYGWLNYLL